MPRHLFVDISSHGFGHLGQTAPVIAALQTRQPGLRLTIRSGLPSGLLKARICGEFHHIATASDFGFVQLDAVSIDHEATRMAYLRAHQDFSTRVEREAELLAELGPDLVLSNVSYLPLAGARRAGIVSGAMSSLDWHGLAMHFYSADPAMQSTLREMADAYRAADQFLALTPGMPPSGLPRVCNIGPVATIAADHERQVVRQALGVGERECVVLVAMGGFQLDCPTERWPVREGLRYLLPAAWPQSHPSALRYGIGEFAFASLLRAADAVVTKPGYGTFVEAACTGTPVLYLRREDWPEQEFLIDWLQKHDRCDEISRTELADGTWTEVLERGLKKPLPKTPVPTGAHAASSIFANNLAS